MSKALMVDPEASNSGQIHLEIPVESPPNRIVSLVPSVTESLFELDLGSRVVGRTEDCVLPINLVDPVPQVGSVNAPDIGAIIDLNPDLVIVDQEQNRSEDIVELQATNVPVWVTFPKTIADVFNMLWNVMYVCEETSMVPRVRLLEQTYDWVLAVTEANEEHVCKVFVPTGSAPLRVFNQDTYMHQVLVACGGTNIFAERNDRYSEVGWDDIVKAQPDVILLPEGKSGGFASQDVAETAKLDTPAARNNRIHLVDWKLLFWPGIRLAFALEVIPPLLCAED